MQGCFFAFISAELNSGSASISLVCVQEVKDSYFSSSSSVFFIIVDKTLLVLSSIFLITLLRKPSKYYLRIWWLSKISYLLIYGYCLLAESFLALVVIYLFESGSGNYSSFGASKPLLSSLFYESQYLFFFCLLFIYLPFLSLVPFLPDFLQLRLDYFCDGLQYYSDSSQFYVLRSTYSACCCLSCMMLIILLVKSCGSQSLL